jgi:hypothetical protein
MVRHDSDPTKPGSFYASAEIRESDGAFAFERYQ